MAEKGLWFDDDLDHSAQDWAEFFGGAFSTGVNVYDNPKSLQVEFKTGMTVKVNSGKAYINGRYYNSGGDLEFALTSYTGNIKYVRIVVRVDMSAKHIKAFMKEGETLPGLTRDNSTYEISLAKITIPAGATTITNTMIVDERSNREVCGFFRFAGHEAERVPSGTVQHYAGQTTPTGWLECDGRLVSRSVYSDLFNAIGTTFGVGDGSTTFALPDLRGEFIRGWDNGRGVDVGRSFGSHQAGTSGINLAGEMIYQPSNYDKNGTNTSNTYNETYYLNNSYHTDDIAVMRPRNVALLPIIKI